MKNLYLYLISSVFLISLFCITVPLYAQKKPKDKTKDHLTAPQVSSTSVNTFKQFQDTLAVKKKQLQAVFTAQQWTALDAKSESFLAYLQTQQTYLKDSVELFLYAYQMKGFALERKENYAQALVQYEEMLTLTRQLPAKVQKQYLFRIYRDIGGIYGSWKKLQQGLRYYQMAEQIIQDTTSVIPLTQQANLYMVLGNLHQNLKNWQESQQYYQKAYDIKRQRFGENHAFTTAILQSIGILYQSQRQFRQALEVFRAVLAAEAARPKQVGLGGLYIGFGYAYIGLAKPDSALYYFRLAQGVYRAMLPEAKHLYHGYAWRSIGQAYTQQGRFAEASRAYKQALGQVLAVAPDTLSDALPVVAEAAHTPFVLEVLRLQAQAYYTQYQQKKQQEDLSSAFAWYAFLDSLSIKATMQETEEADALVQAEEAEAFYTEALEVCSEAAWQATPQAHSMTERSFYFAERKKAGVLRRTTQEAEAQQFGAIPDSLLSVLNTLKINLKDTERNLAEKPTGIQKFILQKKLFDNRRSYEGLIRQIERDYPAYYQLKYAQTILTIPQIQARLSPQEAVLEYAFGKEHLFIFYTDGTRFERRAVAYDSTLFRQIDQLLRVIRRMDEDGFAAVSYTLYDRLIAPVQDLLKGKNRLCVIPEGQLNRLPFEVLLTVRPKAAKDFTQLPYLLKGFAVRYYPSATLAFQQIVKRSQKTTGFLGFAPVEFALKNQIAAHLPLTQSEDEIRQIGELFEAKGLNATLLARESATEANLLQNIGNAQFIHLSTHGTLNQQYALSYLACYPADSLAQKNTAFANRLEGRLYAGEIYNLPLHADLVTLSSCETGVGQLVNGEGILSVLWAFMYAGAGNIVYSLWKLPDLATGELMIAFYQNHLIEKKDFATALQQAKLKLIMSPNTAFPRNWAGLVLVGKF